MSVLVWVKMFGGSSLSAQLRLVVFSQILNTALSTVEFSGCKKSALIEKQFQILLAYKAIDILLANVVSL